MTAYIRSSSSFKPSTHTTRYGTSISISVGNDQNGIALDLALKIVAIERLYLQPTSPAINTDSDILNIMKSSS